MLITNEQWKIIDAPVKARLDCSCGPVCDDCKKAMYESHELHNYYKNYNRSKYKKVSSTTQSKSLMWYEVTLTFPDKDLNKARISIDKLKKYSQYKYIDGRFEIGKGGLYHMHFLIKTCKYLRTRNIYEINNKKGVHVTRLRGKDGLKFQNYIEKDIEEEKPTGWDFNFSQ